MGRRRGWMCVLACLAVSLSAAGQTAPQAGGGNSRSNDQKEIYNYTLTMDKIRRLAATQKDLQAARKQQPALGRTEDEDSTGNLEQAARAIERSPREAAAIRKNGFTPREYVVATMALIQAGAAEAFKKAAAASGNAPATGQLVSPANLKFLEQHQEEIAGLLPGFSAGAH